MYCSYCGKENDQVVKYCSYCGSPMDGTEVHKGKSTKKIRLIIIFLVLAAASYTGGYLLFNDGAQLERSLISEDWTKAETIRSRMYKGGKEKRRKRLLQTQQRLYEKNL